MLKMKWACMRRQMQITLRLVMHASIATYYTQFIKTHLLMLAMKWAYDDRNIGYSSDYACIHKTHRLMLHWQWSEHADEKRKGYSCMVMHASMHIQFSKLTHWCWQWSEQMRRKTGHALIHTQFSKLTSWCWQWSEQMRRKTAWSCINACNSEKLTGWCWQWSKQMRRETGYSDHAYMQAYTQFSNSQSDVGNEASRWGEKQVTLVMHACIHNSVLITHNLMLAMKLTMSRCMRRENSHGHVRIYTYNYVANSVKLTAWC